MKFKKSLQRTFTLHILLTFLKAFLIVSIVGLCYSLFYEIAKDCIKCLPNIGTTADFWGVIGTILTVMFTWQQILDTRRQSNKEIIESRKQFVETIKEMQIEREEAYRPDLYFDTEIISIQYKKDSNKIDTYNQSFKMINVGIGTAKNIKVSAYSSDNYDKLCESMPSLEKNSHGIKDVKSNLFYKDNFGKTVSDEIVPINGKYLFPRDDIKIPLPKVYLYALKDYCAKLFAQDKIDADPYYNLPKFEYTVTYQDQEELQYSKSVIIEPIINSYQYNDKSNVFTYNFDLKIENLPSKKIEKFFNNQRQYNKARENE